MLISTWFAVVVSKDCSSLVEFYSREVPVTLAAEGGNIGACALQQHQCSTNIPGNYHHAKKKILCIQAAVANVNMLPLRLCGVCAALL